MEYLEQARKFVEDRSATTSTTQTARRARPLGVGARPGSAATRCCSPASSTGWRSCSCSRATASATAWSGTPRAAARRPAVRRRASGEGPVPPAASSRGRDDAPAHRRGGRGGASTTRRRTPAPTSAAMPAPVRPTVAAASWDSVIFDVRPRVARCGCRCWSRCAAPRRTWASCSTAARPRAALDRSTQRRALILRRSARDGAAVPEQQAGGQFEVGSTSSPSAPGYPRDQVGQPHVADHPGDGQRRRPRARRRAWPG